MTSRTATLAPASATPAVQHLTPVPAGVELKAVPGSRDCYVCGGSDGEHYRSRRVTGLAGITTDGIPVYRLACRHNAL